MMFDATLIRDFGPIAIFTIYILPRLIDRVMGSIDVRQQAIADAARAPYEALNTILSERAKSELIATQLIVLTAAVERVEATVIRVEDLVKQIVHRLETFIERKPQ
jgi:hypothetical protein